MEQRNTRRAWPRDPDQFYTEPRWCSERLFAVEAFAGRIVDPCAGTGNIVASARAAGLQADGFDLQERGVSDVRGGLDFLAEAAPYLPGTFPCDCIVFNPPYGRAPDGRRLEDLAIRQALKRARMKVAAFLPTSFLNGRERGLWLESTPLYRVWVCSPRPSCPPGHLVMSGEAGGSGTTDYAFFVFLHGFEGHPTIRFLRRDGGTA